ncbi:YrrS family protein [Ectobacillus sp. JY-23]|uniref:YrrS family protein n=1 Tax=Ectobacillus sp. JY-23 TaxID=2933872 RepID=UPI001FF67442|nr:YrrS family protein [Ectobacillus sp. JY-23]UOY94100.1 YrrS family protein [Ectobacillus sp. JY-23]
MPQLEDNSRLQTKRQKRRKAWFLNIFIGIVLLAAVTVAYQTFFATPTVQEQAPKKEVTKKEEPKKEQKMKKEISSEKPESKPKEKVIENPAPVVEDQKVQVPESQSPGVAEAYTNPSWKPIGTAQSEPHVTKFDSSSQDWKEMTQAISYALDIPADTLTILFLGNNGPNKAIGTVQAKDTKERFKVYIEWVEGQGWQPTLVHKLM